MHNNDIRTRLRRADQAVMRAMNTALKPAGVTMAQHGALAELEAQPGITAAALARACAVTPQAVMVLVRAMEQQGLVERRAHPRHDNVLELHVTKAGVEALRVGRELIQPLEAKVRAALTEPGLHALGLLLGRYAEAIERG